MCGILGFLGHQNSNLEYWTIERVKELAEKIKHRGPDWSGIYYSGENPLVFMVHHKLVVYSTDGSPDKQPILSDDQRYILAYDGEIFNYKDFDDILSRKYSYTTDSNGEFLLHIFENFQEVEETKIIPPELEIDLNSDQTSNVEKEYWTLLNQLKDDTITIEEAFKNILFLIDGFFSFLIHDKTKNFTWIARDNVGISPLYYGITRFGEMMISSEKKAIKDDCVLIKDITRGHFAYGNFNKNLPVLISFSDRKFISPYSNMAIPHDINDGIKDLMKSFSSILENIFRKNIDNTQTPFGFYLDNNYISWVIMNRMSIYIKDYYNLWGSKLHVFVINLKSLGNDSDLDLVLSQNQYIHCHHLTYTENNVWESISDIIYYLETAEVDMIRQAIPIFNAVKKINADFNLKLLFTGVGSDVLMAKEKYVETYNPETVHNDLVNGLETNLSNYTKLISGCGLSSGVELRSIGLDRDYLSMIGQIHPDFKINIKSQYGPNINKFFIRELAKKYNYFPSIRYKKDSEIEKAEKDIIQEIITQKVNTLISDQEFQTGFLIYPDDPPLTKEAYYYRKIYLKHFGKI